MIAGLLALCCLGGPALRVALDRGAVELALPGPVRLVIDGGEPVSLPTATITAGDPAAAGEIVVDSADGAPIAAEIRSRPGKPAARRRYRGELIITPAPRARLMVVNRLDLDDYLRGVLPLELGAAPPEALRAQAIAARSYALARRGDGTRPGADFDVRGTQAYLGVGPELPACDEAVRDTAGCVLTIDDRPLEAVYSACCGGLTADAAEAWQSTRPGLRPVPCGRHAAGREPFDGFLTASLGAFCRRHPGFRWRRTIARADLPRPTARIGEPRRLEVRRRGPSGRVLQLAVVGADAEEVVRGSAIRALFAPEPLPSTLFEIAEADDGVVLHGGGRGHGVGLCQAGAIGQARDGATAEAILGWYYPDATIRRLDEVGYGASRIR